MSLYHVENIPLLVQESDGRSTKLGLMNRRQLGFEEVCLLDGTTMHRRPQMLKSRGFCKTRDCDMRSAGEGHSFDLDETHSGNYR